MTDLLINAYNYSYSGYHHYWEVEMSSDVYGTDMVRNTLGYLDDDAMLTCQVVIFVETNIVRKSFFFATA